MALPCTHWLPCREYPAAHRIHLPQSTVKFVIPQRARSPPEHSSPQSHVSSDTTSAPISVHDASGRSSSTPNRLGKQNCGAPPNRSSLTKYASHPMTMAMVSYSHDNRKQLMYYYHSADMQGILTRVGQAQRSVSFTRRNGSDTFVSSALRRLWERDWTAYQ